jgi:menaquinol-cytochrome c reductase iron-sulfur subunit
VIDESRRRFLTRLSIGLTGLITGVIGLPILGYLLGPLVRPAPNEWRAVGKVADWQVGQTRLVKLENPASLPWAGTTAESAAWVRRTTTSAFVTFSVHCTHLGCPVNWIDTADLFLCPCHGGAYYPDGTVAAGPPPRPLYPLPWRINGENLELQTITLPTQYGGPPPQ